MGSAEVLAILGGLRQGDCGLYVSTGGFTNEAEYEPERAAFPATLIDLDMLASLLDQYYESIDSFGRAVIPLTRILWPTDEGACGCILFRIIARWYDATVLTATPRFH